MYLASKEATLSFVERLKPPEGSTVMTAKAPYVLYCLVFAAIACLAALPALAHVMLTGTP